MTVDHGVAHELLRSDDFRVTAIGVATCPSRCAGSSTRPTPGLLHPLRPPSLLSVEPPDHTRYRKLVSSVFTPRAVATLRDRVEQTATALLDELEGDTDVVDIVDRYCSQLPVAIIGDILGVPDEDRPRILHFGEMGAPSLDIGLSWRQYQQVHAGHRGLQQLARRPPAAVAPQSRRRPDEPDHQGLRRRSAASNNDELQALAGPGAGRRLRNHSQPAGQRNSDAARRAGASRDAGRPPRAVAQRRRGDPSAGVTGADERAHRVQGRRRGRHPRAAGRAGGPAPGRAPTATRRSSPIRIASTSNATTRASICPSPAAGTSASVRRWPAPKGRSGCARSSSAIPDARLAGSGSRRDTRVLRGWSSLPVRLGASHDSTVVTWISALRSSTRPRRSANSIRTADPATPVPTCPDWTLKQLFRHVGRGNRWAAQIVADRARRGARPPRSARRQAARRSRRAPSTGSTRAPDSSSTPWTPSAPTLRSGRSSDPARAMVDPPPAARSDGAPRRRGDRASAPTTS